MAAPTGPEQELLEWVNRFRIDPAGEFDRLVSASAPVGSAIPGVASAVSYFGVDLNLLRTELGQLSPVPPLAWSSALQTAALGHNQQMIAADSQSHQLRGEASLGARATAAGYTSWNRLAENVYAFAQSVAYAHAGFVIDWGAGLGGMQNPRGHRDTLMNGALREVGISVVSETNGATSVGPLVVTQDFGTRSTQSQPFLLGVVFDDGLGNQFYDSGEGLAGVQVTASGLSGTFNTVTTASGGYQMTLPTGNYTVTFQGGPLGGPVVRGVSVGSQNVKLDLDRSRSGIAVTPTPIVQFERTQIEGVEGTTFELALVRSGEVSGELTVRVATVAGTAGADDLTGPGFVDVRFAAGQSRASFAFATVDDAVIEGTESFAVQIAAGAGYAVGTTSRVTIIVNDNDVPAEHAPTIDVARVIQTSTRQVTVGLKFLGDLDLRQVSQRTIYTLRRAGRDRRLGTRDDVRIAASRVRYDATSGEFQLSFNVSLRTGETVQLVVRPEAVRSPLGLTLVGPPSRSLRIARR